MPSIPCGIIDAIGGTPLIRFNRFLENDRVELIVKFECFNPGGSAKDRPAKLMIEQALKRGELTPGGTVVESTSGNMGIGLAQVCNHYGLNLICVVDSNAQSGNLAIIKALGASVEMVSEPINGDFLTARIRKVGEILGKVPNSFWPNQYENSDNYRAHQEGAIREIDEVLKGDFDHIFVGTSSTGTIQGCQRYLDSQNHHVKVTAVDAKGSVLFGGSAGKRIIPGLGAGLVPPLGNSFECNMVSRVSDQDCVIGCRRAAAKESTLIGGSAGGVLQAIRQRQRELEGQRCVAILHDSGTRYLDTVYSDLWVQEHLKLSPEKVSELANDLSY